MSGYHIREAGERGARACIHLYNGSPIAMPQSNGLRLTIRAIVSRSHGDMELLKRLRRAARRVWDSIMVTGSTPRTRQPSPSHLRVLGVRI